MPKRIQKLPRYRPTLFQHWQKMYKHDKELGKINFPVFVLLIVNHYKCNIRFLPTSQILIPDNFNLSEMLPLFRAYEKLGILKQWRFSRKADSLFMKWRDTRQTVTATTYKGK